MFAKGYQSRKFLLTINNPESAGMTHEEIIDRAQKFNPDYFCMADEIGASGTYHTHVYLYSESPMRFETVKKRFPTAHIDKAAGSSRSNRDYIRKEGKWADTDKADTRVEGSFKEFGTIPDESEEKAPRMAQLMKHIQDGLSNVEILQIDPSYLSAGSICSQESAAHVSDLRRHRPHHTHSDAPGQAVRGGADAEHWPGQPCR